MDRRVNELRDRLWKKKAALQQKENLPVSGLWAGGQPRAVSSRQRLRGQCWLCPPRRGGAQSCLDVTHLLVPVAVPTCVAPVFWLILVLKGGVGGELTERCFCLGVSSRLWLELIVKHDEPQPFLDSICLVI